MPSIRLLASLMLLLTVGCDNPVSTELTGQWAADEPDAGGHRRHGQYACGGTIAPG
jgi:hypothetical protein